jgi:hypothetical protein
MDDWQDRDRLPEPECVELLDRLLPNGPAGEDVRNELAPDGWASSPLRHIDHPTPEQIHEERVRLSERMDELSKTPPDDREPPPTLAQVRAEHEETPIDVARECRDLVTMCLWDVFSNNHEVSDAEGRLVDLGSHRGSAGFLADWLNAKIGLKPESPEQQLQAMMAASEAMQSGGTEAMMKFMDEQKTAREAENRLDYMDFYMGTAMVAHRADLTPVYRLIFRRLRGEGCTWKYSFPRLHLVKFDKPADEGPEDFEAYDPSAAFAEQQEDDEREADVEKMQADLDEGYREAAEAAQDAEPPEIVRAFEAEYGELPEGWPPDPEV